MALLANYPGLYACSRHSRKNACHKLGFGHLLRKYPGPLRSLSVFLAKQLSRPWVWAFAAQIPRTRFERVTYCLGGSCSILLSYRGAFDRLLSEPEWRDRPTEMERIWSIYRARGTVSIVEAARYTVRGTTIGFPLSKWYLSPYS